MADDGLKSVRFDSGIPDIRFFIYQFTGYVPDGCVRHHGRGDGTGGYGRGNGSGSSSTSSGGRKRGRGGDDNLSAEQSEALEALRQFRRNKCFGCGKEGHRREKCDATDVELAAFQEKVDKLKSKINRK